MVQHFLVRCHLPEQKKTEQRDDVIKKVHVSNVVTASHLIWHWCLFLALSQEMSKFPHQSTYTLCFRLPLLPLLLWYRGLLSPEWHLSPVVAKSHPLFAKSVPLHLFAFTLCRYASFSTSLEHKNFFCDISGFFQISCVSIQAFFCANRKCAQQQVDGYPATIEWKAATRSKWYKIMMLELKCSLFLI